MAEGNPNDGLWMLFFLLFIICGIAFIIWIAFTPQILQAYLWLREGQAYIGALWTDDDKIIETVMGPMTFQNARDFIETTTPQMLMREDVPHWSIINATSVAILTPLKWPFGLIMGFWTLWALFKSPTSQHRKTYDLDGLVDVQSQTFPIINPIRTFNPLNDVPHRAPGDLVPAQLPQFAEALSPEEWMAYYRIPNNDGVTDEDAVEEAFKLQLGQPWKGYQKLKPYEQVMLAAFALKTSRKRDESDDMLGELAKCWSFKGGVSLNGSLVSKARRVLKNKNLSELVLKECNRHAFVTTAMLGALEKARAEGGVLAPAQFLWLRGHDRNLWYPMNNLGRQSFHAEALGAMSHFRAEKHVQRPIPKPMLKDAVNVITAYINNKDLSSPIPQLDFSMVKNKKAPNKNEGIMKPAGT